MKKAFFSLAMLCAIGSMSFAQTFPGGIPGLKFRLDLIDNPTSFNASTGSWLDGTGSGLLFVPPTTANKPLLVSPSFSTPFKAVRFDGIDDHLIEGTILTGGNGFNTTEGTFFVVRASDVSQQCTSTPSWGNYQCMIALGERDNFSGTPQRSYLNEMSMGSDWALHHSSSGNYSLRNHQCFGSLPWAQPAVLTACFGQSTSDINYYVNDILSGQPIATPAPPGGSPFVANPRDITIGARYAPPLFGGPGANGPLDFFNGDIYEIIAYNRKLTPAEIHQVNEYLKCKYSIKYANSLCNVQPLCTNSNCSFKDKFGNTVYPFTTSLGVAYTGANAQGNCTFTATAGVVVTAGYAVTGYEWHFPDGTTSFTSTPALSDSKSFTLSAGTMPGSPMKVIVHGYNAMYQAGDPNWCCDAEMSTTVWCNASGVGGNY